MAAIIHSFIAFPQAANTINFMIIWNQRPDWMSDMGKKHNIVFQQYLQFESTPNTNTVCEYVFQGNETLAKMAHLPLKCTKMI